MKIWRGNENTDDKIIAFINQTIYKGNPATLEIEHCITAMRNGMIPDGNFFGIPLHYIKEIRLQEGKEYIEISFRGSLEHLNVRDEILSNEIFNYFKENIPDSSSSIDRYSKLRAGKKPLIAMAVITVIFLYSLYYAVGYDQGYQYEISNGHYNSITGIALWIASYGVKNDVFFFGSLLLIAIFAYVRKAKNPPVINLIQTNY
ncbi:hypothetical protein BH11BAC4_BH11BAC4_04510 [soil metagenome]